MNKLEEEGEQNRDQKKPDDGLAKIAISKDADRAVSEILSRVSDGFDAGRPTKHEVTSQIILRFFNACTDADVQALRVQFFNPILVMEAMIRKAKETGAVPNSMRDFLYDQYMASSARQPAVKKIKKSLPANVINDNILKLEDSA